MYFPCYLLNSECAGINEYGVFISGKRILLSIKESGYSAEISSFLYKGKYYDSWHASGHWWGSLSPACIDSPFAYSSEKELYSHCYNNLIKVIEYHNGDGHENAFLKALKNYKV